jgi:hypothetical protein
LTRLLATLPLPTLTLSILPLSILLLALAAGRGGEPSGASWPPPRRPAGALAVPAGDARGRPAGPGILLLGPATRVSGGGAAGAPHLEPFLAAHPADPALLFGAAVTFPDGAPGRGIDETTVAGFRSSDGGRSWARVPFPRCRVDPWVSFGKDRDLYLSCLAPGGAVDVYRSADAGRRWNRPVRIAARGGGSADHPILAVDRSAGPRGGAVYAVFAQQLPAVGYRQRRLFAVAVAASADRGRSFSAPVLLPGGSSNRQPFDAAVLADGTLALLFMDYESHAAPRAPRKVWLARSADGGRTFATAPLPVERRGEGPRGVGGGASPLDEPPGAPQREPTSNLLGGRVPMPLAVDRSGPADRIYVALAGPWQPAPARQDGAPPQAAGSLCVIGSDDGGKSWGSATAVAGGSPAGARATPAIAVNGAGVVGVAWYDSRPGPRSDCFDLFFSASLDRGKTFLSPVRVTPETSCPSAAGSPAVAARWPFGGDYSGLAATADGRFHLFWADTRTGAYQVWTAAADVAP